MYLTRFRINPARRGARKLLSSPQALHAAVLAGFPSPADHSNANARTLWRLDQAAIHDVQLYIASPTEPDLTHLVEQAGWPTTEAWQTRSYQPFLNTLEAGQTWAFRLTANPSRDVRVPDAKDTKRVGAVTIEHQTRWLTERAERNGFAILLQDSGDLNLVVHKRQTLDFVRSHGQRRVTIVTATYDGVLQVENPDLLRKLLTTGLGHAKAYGCGLLTLAPAVTQR